MSTVSKQQWLAGVKSIHEGTAAAHLGIDAVDASDDHVELRMEITAKVRQPLGLLHGGVSMVLAETAASIHATWGIDLNEKYPVGIEINGSHLRSATDGHVRAIARVLRRTQSFIFHQIDIIHEESGEMLCTARVTNYYRKRNNE